MKNANTGRAPRAAAGLLASTLALSGAVVAATTPAAAAPSFALERVAGPDRYATSAAIADKFGQSTGAILASGESGRFADALSANFLAGVRDVPVLLTQSKSVPPVVLAALKRAGVRDITLVGGTDVISAEQESALRSELFTVTRLGGADRFATSQHVIAAGQAAAAPVGIVATGLDFADALGAGPLSYRGKHPMFLVRRDSVPDETLAAMRAAGTTSVIVVGGEAVVGRAVVDALGAAGISVMARLAGPDRSATSVALAEHLAANGFEKAAFNLASGQNGGVDALGGAALSGKQGRALLITNTATNAGSVASFTQTNGASLTGTGYVFGGPAAVSDRVLEALDSAGSANQPFVVTVGGANGVVQSGDTRDYSMDVGSVTSVDIQLFECSNVTTGTDGVVTFAGTNPGGSGNAAVTQDVKSTVTTVNGVPGASADEVVPRSGVVTFTVTAHPDDTCVLPVVFPDPGDLDRLTLDSAGRPSSPFGLAGQITVRATDAAAGSIAAADVTRVDVANDFFETGTGATARSFVYAPSRDVFRLAGAGDTSTALTAAEFEARLSLGDSLTGIYNPTQGSTFTLADLAPLAPTGVAARTPQGANAGKAGLELTFADSGTGSVLSYDVLRATAVASSVIGEPATCPDPSSSSGAATYSGLGTVADVAAQTSYVFFDATATPPASGETSPQYCYVVRAADQSGDISDFSTVAGPATAAAAASSTPVTAMSFVADGTAVTGLRTVTVRFNHPVNASTVTAAGSDFKVTSTSGSIVTDLAIASAAVSGTNTDVVISLSADVPSAGDVHVTSRTGADGDTVCEGTGTSNCQPVGQIVLAAVDRTPPAFTTAVAALNGTGNDTVVLNYSEAVGFFGTGSPNLQFAYDPDCDGGLKKVFGGVAQTTETSLTLTLADGTLPTTLDDNDCVRYIDSDPAVDPGDVVDASGNAQAPSTVAVPEPAA